eukprot:1324349-Alexandrium_andersonii.AAC.1
MADRVLRSSRHDPGAGQPRRGFRTAQLTLAAQGLRVQAGDRDGRWSAYADAPAPGGAPNPSFGGSE